MTAPAALKFINSLSWEAMSSASHNKRRGNIHILRLWNVKNNPLYNIHQKDGSVSYSYLSWHATFIYKLRGVCVHIILPENLAGVHRKKCYRTVPCNHRHVCLCCECNDHQFVPTKERQTPLTGQWIGLIAQISITKPQTLHLTSVWICSWMTSFPSYDRNVLAASYKAQHSEKHT